MCVCVCVYVCVCVHVSPRCTECQRGLAMRKVSVCPSVLDRALPRTPLGELTTLFPKLPSRLGTGDGETPSSFPAPGPSDLDAFDVSASAPLVHRTPFTTQLSSLTVPSESAPSPGVKLNLYHVTGTPGTELIAALPSLMTDVIIP